MGTPAREVTKRRNVAGDRDETCAGVLAGGVTPLIARASLADAVSVPVAAAA